MVTKNGCVLFLDMGFIMSGQSWRGSAGIALQQHEMEADLMIPFGYLAEGRSEIKT